MPHLDLLRSTRRHFLASQSLSIAGLALAWLLDEDRASANPARPEGRRGIRGGGGLWPRARTYQTKSTLVMAPW